MLASPCSNLHRSSSLIGYSLCNPLQFPRSTQLVRNILQCRLLCKIQFCKYLFLPKHYSISSGFYSPITIFAIIPLSSPIFLLFQLMCMVAFMHSCWKMIFICKRCEGNHHKTFWSGTNQFPSLPARTSHICEILLPPKHFVLSLQLVHCEKWNDFIYFFTVISATAIRKYVGKNIVY